MKTVSGLMLTLLISSLLSVNMIGITVAQPVHDIAVISVTPSQTSVKLGELVNITVVVENQGTEHETFNVTAYHDTTTIETKTDITLAAGANTFLTFTWNTTNIKEEIYATEKKEETYTINATASIVPGETDTADNTLISPSTIRVISQYITVLPQSTVDTTLTPGKNYMVSIYTDYNGSDVWGWEFRLTYNPYVLHGVEVTNGDLITKVKHPSATFQPGTFDNDNGKLSLTSAYFSYITPPAPLTYGPGTLANVTFTVVGTGDSDIELGTETIAPSRLVGVTEDGYGYQYPIIDDILPWFGHILHGYFCNTVAPVISASIDVNPNALNLCSKGEWVTCYIELPEGYDVSDIDIYSIRLNDTFSVSLLVVPPVPVPTEIGDYDGDGVPDLMVKFNMTELTSYICLQGIEYGNVTLTITGNLTDEATFEGEDTVKVLLPGDLDHDGDVDSADFVIFCGACPSKPPQNPEADLDRDGDVDSADFVNFCGYYGTKL